MTISEALHTYATIESDLLLGHVLKQPKEFLYIHGDQKLTAKQAFRFENMASKRQKGVPIAYLLGYKYFYGQKFKVSKDVLIPRPESEWLVDEVLHFLDKTHLSVLDVGTGSGCIAISVAKRGKALVTASDISVRALTVAKSNAPARLKIKFVQSDLLNNINQTYDIIVANLPYVPLNDYEKFYTNLQYEPKLALTDGTNAFVVVERFIKQSKEFLNPDGKIFIETDPASIKQLLHLAKTEFPEKRVSAHCDLNNFERFIRIV